MGKGTEVVDHLQDDAGGTYDYSKRKGTRIEYPDDYEGDEDQLDQSETPVVGWLAVVDGPGKGHSRELTFGVNKVGQGSSNRVSLNFGDEKISEDDHFRVVYDDHERSFHIVPGQSMNLVRIAGKAVLTVQQIDAMAELEVGSTRLCFVPLCTTDWSWGQPKD